MNGGPASASCSIVSVVVATLDRPDKLQRCLRSLIEQCSSRSLDIVVVDNNPISGLTPPVIAAFPAVRLVSERRRGLAYARNKGFLASRGAIVVTTDDDVVVPAGWLDALIDPFVRPEVAVVTGNVLPLELATRAQRLFESYGGLGRGPTRKVVDRGWFDSFWSAVPTWTLGATANAAFRAALFDDPCVGLMDEALGPGTPTGVGEDTYLFYKVLKAGYVIVYEPSAYVWHEHRREMPALRRQIYHYSRGHVGYHLTTLLRDGDLRALLHLGLVLPAVHAARVLRRLGGRSEYPCSLTLLEVLGNLAGPWAWWRSQRRVARDGRTRSGAAGGTVA